MAAIYLNGKIVDRADAKVSVYDHGFLYGDGVFEGMRLYSGRVFRHREHIERLYESGRAIAMEIPTAPAAMIAAVEQTAKAYGKRTATSAWWCRAAPGRWDWTRASASRRSSSSSMTS